MGCGMASSGRLLAKEFLETFWAEEEWQMVSDKSAFSLAEGTVLHIGRDSDCCDIVIDQPGVSRLHAVLYRRRETVHIIDMKSKNGIYVNDIRLEGYAGLSEGDSVRIGDVRMTLCKASVQGSNTKNGGGSQ